MDELLSAISQKFGLSADKARNAVTAVLGFLRAKLPESATGQLDSAVKSLGLTGPLPEGVDDEATLATKAGIAEDKVHSLVQTVLGFLKDKLPGGLPNLEGLLKEGGGGILQKIASMFGKS
jgi:nucleoid DNA-binding protein